MSLVDTIIDLKGLAKDIKRDLLMREERLFLLKRRGETGIKWTVVKEVTGGWEVKFNEYRAQLQVKISTIDSTFKDQLSQVSFLGYGAGPSIDVYSIDPDRRDVIPPTGNNPDWKIYVTRVNSERFVIPV